MGINNHNRSFYTYMVGNSLDYLLDRAYNFIKNCENSVVKYSKIRAGLCHYSSIINMQLESNKNKFSYLIREGKSDICNQIYRLKREQKEICSVINKLDIYMQTMVNYSYLM